MDYREKVAEKLRALSREGRELLNKSGWDGSSYRGNPPNDGGYAQLLTETRNIIDRVCGSQSAHALELNRLVDQMPSSLGLLPLLGIIEATLRDFEGGFLFELRSLVRADLLGDFIEQAEALLEAGYDVAAASLAGAVLEDTLRKLCDRHGVTYPTRTKIDRMNADLAKAGAFNVLVQKRITHLADIRNKADHGKFDEVKHEDVEDMIQWVGRFVTDHLQ